MTAKHRGGTSGARTFTPDIASFIKRFVDQMANDNAAVFAGAGLSVAAGYVDWKGLLKDIAEELGLSVDHETNLVAVAQYHVNERRNRSVINQRILAEFSAEQEETDSHRIMARLPISTYWTTNYDPLIETALRKTGKAVDVKYTVAQLKTDLPDRDAVVYKMHGDMAHPEGAILTKDDYEGYFRAHEAFVTRLSSDLVSKTMLFLGFSFSDPNIDYVLSRVRVALRQEPKQHYCILRREQKRPREKHASFEYRQRQQKYLIGDLQRIGVHSLLIDDYWEIPEILCEIEEQYRRRTVFVSGSVSDYGSWQPDKANAFLRDLSAGLIRNKLQIVTGFGLGVGPAVIGGALETILGNRKKFKSSQLQAYPFPVGVLSPAGQKRIFGEYREQMIARAGIALFVFGNKRNGRGKLVESDGVRDEFERAKQAGLALLPIGATGAVAQQLWQEVWDDFAKYYPDAGPTLKRNFEAIGQSRSTPEQLIAAVLAIIRALKKEN